MKEFINKLILSILAVLFMAGFRKLSPNPSIFHYLSLLLFILIFYYLFFPIGCRAWGCLRRNYNKAFPKIGILNGSIYSPIRENKCERAWTNVTPSMWILKLKSIIGGRLHLISAANINQSFSIIINPFGDIFLKKT